MNAKNYVISTRRALRLTGWTREKLVRVMGQPDRAERGTYGKVFYWSLDRLTAALNKEVA